MMNTRRAGFTVLELLVAMGLLAALGAFVMQLVANSFEMYRKGDSRGDLYTNAQHIIERIEEDLVAVHPGPDGRLLLEADAFTGVGGGFLLRMVRSIPHGEAEHGVLRKSGTSTNLAGRYSGVDPGITARGEIPPASGLMEVAWALLPDSLDESTGFMTLWRGVSAPAFAEGGFFDVAADETRDAAWVRAHMQPVATDILGCWLLALAQSSVDWDEELVLDGKGDATRSFPNWDSTRGILSQRLFPLARAGSITVPEDDIYPRAVRVVIQVARRDRPEAWLRTRLAETDDVAGFTTTRQLPADTDADQCVKIGSEWVQLGARSSSDASVRRGVRRSKASYAGPGTAVHVGRVFRSTLAIPARRSFWIEEENR
jgi:hypothetical protein